MQQDKNDIENKLRQLENQQLPDLSQMDDHWQQMKHVLAPAANMPKTNGTRFLSINRKILFFAASIAGIILLVWFLVDTDADKATGIQGSKANAVVQAVTEKAAEDTLTKPTTYSTNQKPISARLAITSIYADVSYNSQDAAIFDEGSDSVPFPNNNSVKAMDTEKMIENFYNELQKPAQEFILNAEKGGSILGIEGTKLMVPASAFVDHAGNSISGNVKITVLEYYKYSEMIAANLSTVSNGKQLVTGGMVRITAEQQGRPVKLRSDKAIDLSMPAKDYDEGMQLFISESESNKMFANYTGDTVAGESSSSARYRKINWVQSGIQSSMPVFGMKTNFMNMQDDPTVTRGRDGRIAVFKIPLESPYTAEEAKEILEEKYGDYYQKIKVKKIKRERRVFNFWGPQTYTVRTTIGDSIMLTLNEALRGRYIERKDSAFYAEKIRRDSIQFYKICFAYISGAGSAKANQYIKTQQAYSFRIKNLGWINCDRFFNYDNKTDFVINLPAGAEAVNFVSQLVFISIRSVLPGRLFENKIGFLNVPVNMPVYIVGLGERDGKVVSFMEKLKTGEKEIDVTNFEETTAEAFKKKLAELDLQ